MLASLARRLPPGMGWMALSALSFGAMSLLAHGLKDRIDWRIVVLVRTVSSTLLAGATAPGATLAVLRAPPPALVQRSLAGSLAIVLTFYALPRLPVAHVVTLRHTTPLFMALMPGQGPVPWLALGAAGLGLFLLERPDLVAPGLPVAAALGAACSTAVAMLGLNRLGDLDPRAVVAHYSATASVLALATLVLGGPLTSGVPALPEALALAGLAITGTLGQLFLTRAYTRGEPVRMALAGVTEVVLAAAAEAWIFGRVLGPGELLGVGMVVAGPAMVPARPAPAAGAAR